MDSEWREKASRKRSSDVEGGGGHEQITAGFPVYRTYVHVTKPPKPQIPRTEQIMSRVRQHMVL
jgi:hypothetical protein